MSLNSEREDASRPELIATALSEWSRHVDTILRGVGHSLNNRAAALSAVLELARDPEEDPAVYASILSTELERVTELAATVRAVGAARHAADAFTVAEAVDDAFAALSQHPMARDRRVSFDVAAAPAMRVQRWMYVRALIALGGNGMQASSNTTIRVTGDGDWVVTRAHADNLAVKQGPYVTEIARAMGGEPLPDGSGFRVPSLAAVRKREGRGG
jgi:hypothetical protein